jgi:hypothetical protein
MKRCTRVLGWSDEFCQRVLKGYRDFLHCKILAEDSESSQVIPSIPINQMWQQHILDTKNYDHDCFFLVGQRLHYPTDEPPGESQSQKIADTRKFLCKYLKCDVARLDNEVWAYAPPPMVRLKGTKTQEPDKLIVELDPRRTSRSKISDCVHITIVWNDGPLKKRDTAEFKVTSTMKLNRIFETYAKQRSLPRKSLAFFWRCKDENGNYLRNDSGNWSHKNLNGSEMPQQLQLSNDMELCIDCEPTRWEC